MGGHVKRKTAPIDQLIKTETSTKVMFVSVLFHTIWNVLYTQFPPEILKSKLRQEHFMLHKFVLP